MLLAIDSPLGGQGPALVMPRHPVDAAVDAMLAYFKAAVPYLQDARDDFPDHGTVMDLSQGPILTIDSGLPVYTKCAPGELHTSPLADGGIQTAWRVGYWVAPMQIDLFSAHRAQREDVGWAIDQAFDNGLPRHTGLWLTSEGYYNQPIIADVTGTFTENDSRAAARGEWRRTWNIDVRGDLISFGDSPRIAQLTLKITTTLDGIQHTESTTVLP